MAVWLRAGAALLAVLALTIYAEGDGMMAEPSARHAEGLVVAYSCRIPAPRAALHICPRA